MKDLTTEEIAKCKNLHNWLNRVSNEEIDAALEWLHDEGCLNKKGEAFTRRFWMHTWHKDKKPTRE